MKQRRFMLKTEDSNIIALHYMTLHYITIMSFHLTENRLNVRGLQRWAVVWCLYSININWVSFAFENGLN